MLLRREDGTAWPIRVWRMTGHTFKCWGLDALPVATFVRGG